MVRRLYYDNAPEGSSGGSSEGIQPQVGHDASTKKQPRVATKRPQFSSYALDCVGSSELKPRWERLNRALSGRDPDLAAGEKASQRTRTGPQREQATARRAASRAPIEDAAALSMEPKERIKFLEGLSNELT